MAEQEVEKESVLQMISRVEQTLTNSIKKIPEATAKQLLAEPSFMSRLGKFLVSTGTLDTIISREIHMNNEVASQGADQAAAPAAETLPSDPTPQDQLPTGFDNIPPPTSPDDYQVELLPDNVLSPLAVVRYDSTHALFPNRIVVFMLVENTATHMTYWQINVNPEPFFLMAVEAALHDTPSNMIRRCNAQRIVRASTADE